MDKLKMQTPDLTDKNIERIASLFPNVITETRDELGAVKKAVDFDLLKTTLSKNLVEADDERYRLDWPGKKASLLKANRPITKTLRPCREESVNFDTTENLYIEGDNFEVLKILQESYLGKVKMIYIDPPYNTGNDFIYKDDFAKSREEYDEELGTKDEEGGKLFRNTDSNGRFHSDWLSMMNERLVVARDLLRNDGVIFISIERQEQSNLVKLLNEVFGEENMIGSLIWRKKEGGGMADDHFVTEHEYVLVYRKSGEFLWGDEIQEASESDFNKQDSKGKYRLVKLAKWGNTARREDRPTMYFPIMDPQGNPNYPVAPDGSDGRWRMGKNKVEALAKNKMLEFQKKEDGWVAYEKVYFDPNKGKVNKLRSILYDIGGTGVGTNELTDLFGKKDVFENPKSTKLLESFMKWNLQGDDLILDFFAGSSTTAHAVMQLNSEDEGNRKFIMVQLAEKTDESSEAYKAGYKTIAEIGKERIRRAGKKIVEELKVKNQQLQSGEEPVNPSKLDIGFRVYKTDDTNMKDVFYHPAALDQKQLAFLESNIKEDRTPEDLLTQVILDLGLELSLPVETMKMLKNTVFIVQTNALVACFDNDIDFKIVDTIAGLKPFKVVFKDASFKDDKDRINVEERFKRLSPETKVTVI